MNRIMISAIKSGEGKTTITCGILSALVKKGLKPSIFKCGPDYIDPLFHKSIAKISGCNLDLFFLKKDMMKQLFCEYSENSNISVVEGAMGFYDGVSGNTSIASAYDVSKELDIPTILIIDVKGSSLTLCSIINGVKSFKKNNIRAIIFNNCNKMMYPMYKKMVEENCDLIVLGFVEKNDNYAIKSRHLGLVTADEIENLQEKIDDLSNDMMENINFDELLKLSEKCGKIEYTYKDIVKITRKKPRLAIAKDKAFCFYYQENLDLLHKLGVDLVEFSPINDECLPKNIDGIYIGGGYPELYLNELSKNKSMLKSIKKSIENNIPTFAECGGFMYLMSKIDDKELVNVVESCSFNTGKLTRFGYITITANRDNFLLKKDEKIQAHEFHYFDSTNNGDLFNASKANKLKSWSCFIEYKNLICGFPHMYFYSNIEFAENFIRKMVE